MVSLTEVAEGLETMVVFSYNVPEVQAQLERYLQAAGYTIQFDCKISSDLRLASLVTDFNQKLRDNLGADFDQWLEDKIYELWFIRDTEAAS